LEVPQASLAIERHCVWTFADNALLEPNYGKPCANHSDCASIDPTDAPGACVLAHRAYCPPPCAAHGFAAATVNSAPLSAAAAQLIAAQELALATAQHPLRPADVEARRWHPRCGASGAPDPPECLDEAGAEKLVRTDYALMTVDFLDFDERMVGRGVAETK
jgi:hypothetical protein